MISTDISITDTRWEGMTPHSLAQRAASALLDESPDALKPGEVAILFADDPTVHTLNLEWRGKDKPTNVLSFPADDFPTPDGIAPALGDIALAYETCAKEAAEKHISVENHALHLIVHGFLHLLGYDHQTDTEAEAMEGLERSILSRLGVADPYSG